MNWKLSLETIIIVFLVFNALLTQKIVTSVYKNRKVKREKKSLHIQPGNIIIK